MKPVVVQLPMLFSCKKGGGDDQKNDRFKHIKIVQNLKINLK
ncbi:hypothetical protein AsAng_0049510 [Aureispira anguillae]|uniref:Lipoprotein n=1 Tax=Aureispira anguillae TaxID=2864201 RepID=A0A915YJ59_9BACT|nr:hypothetical protein AsAng_0049510 [Aureispira anguillae]